MEKIYAKIIIYGKMICMGFVSLLSPPNHTTYTSPLPLQLLPAADLKCYLYILFRCVCTHIGYVYAVCIMWIL